MALNIKDQVFRRVAKKAGRDEWERRALAFGSGAGMALAGPWPRSSLKFNKIVLIIIINQLIILRATMSSKAWAGFSATWAHLSVVLDLLCPSKNPM
jgi:hypothetical protein